MSRRRLELVRPDVARTIALSVLAVAGVLVGISAGTKPTVTPAAAVIGWRGDYESGDFSQWAATQAVTGDAVIVTSPVRQGRYAAKYTVKSGDDPIGATGERAESYISQEATDGYDGHEVWYAWSTMIASGSALDSGGWNIFSQWHNTGTACSPPMVAAVDGSTRTIYFRSWGGPLNETNCSNPYRQQWTLGQLTFDRWYDFVVHVKWSADPTIGFVEVWMNGQKAVPLFHTATAYTGQGLYWKVGWYRGETAGTTVTYNDGAVVASDYAGAITAFPSGSWPATLGGAATTTTTNATQTSTATTATAVPTTTAVAPTTAAKTTAAAATTAAATTTAATTTTTAAPAPAPAAPAAPAATAQTTTAANDGKKPPSPPGQERRDAAGAVTPSGPGLERVSAPQGPSRVLAAANVNSRAGSGIEGRFVRVLSAAVVVRGTQSLRISVIRSAGVHRRQPLLAHSFVGSVDPMYWRKTVVTGPMDDGRVGLELRIPNRVLKPGQRYAIRVRAVGSTGIRTIYIRFRG